MRSLSVMVGFVMATALPLFAADGPMHHHAGHSGMSEATKAPAGPAGGQKTCPVSGEAINKDIFVEQDGLKVYFCCRACTSKFKESPNAYLPAVYKQLYPQSVQVKCPVMGGPVDPKTSIDHNGQRINFCCPGCEKPFKADPAKYLAKMDEVSTRQVHCPVTGKAIDLGVSTEVDGGKVYFSDKEALAKFEANPSKYAGALRPEAGVVARGATFDDDFVLGLASDGGVQTARRKDLKGVAFQGKTYFVLGDAGATRFQSDPAKYAQAVDAQMTKPPGSVGARKAGGGCCGGKQHDAPKGCGGHAGGDHAGHRH